MNAVVEMVGQKFGRLTVVSRDSHRGGFALWRCRCDCSTEVVARGRNLRSGNTASCGCSRTKHGHTVGRKRTQEFICWDNMLRRCTDPNARGYKNYGGRGIKVCKRWQKFSNFLTDMGLKPSPKLSIERVKNNKGYTPKNCIWATRSVQNRNRRKLPRRKRGRTR